MSTEELGRKYPIVMAAYDPQWPVRFEAEARYLRARFGPDVIPRVEHFGSTAVPGLAANCSCQCATKCAIGSFAAPASVFGTSRTKRSCADLLINAQTLLNCSFRNASRT